MRSAGLSVLVAVGRVLTAKPTCRMWVGPLHLDTSHCTIGNTVSAPLLNYG
jgi:hypothetical protein